MSFSNEVRSYHAQPLILYHFFHPDDVVSSRHFSDLAAAFAERGWKVVARPSNRSCRDQRCKYAALGTIRSVIIDRIWRPAFPSSSASRATTECSVDAGSVVALSGSFPAPDVLIIGSDPIFSVLVAIPWKIVRPKTKIVHWCFDLYPEAAIADGTLCATGPGMNNIGQTLTSRIWLLRCDRRYRFVYERAVE